MKAARFAAHCSNKKKNKKSKKKILAHYTTQEIHAKVGGVGGEYLRADIAELERHKLIEFSSEKITMLSGMDEEDVTYFLNRSRSKKRYVPVPRRMLDYLASCSRPSLMKTALALILRALSFAKDGSIKVLGTIKASLIASATGISLRSVRTARKALIGMGFISADTDSTQWKLNKTGSYFAINTKWSPPLPSSYKVPTLGEKEAIGGVLNSCSKSEFAPPHDFPTGEFAPPYKDYIPSIRTLKDQNLVNSSSGVLSDNSKTDIETPPTINNILKEDLFNFPRLEELYQQALIAKWFLHSENMVLNWISAAVHARSAKDGDPVRIFVTIVKKKLWHHITNHDEDYACSALKKFRDKDPSCYCISQPSKQEPQGHSFAGLLGSVFKRFK
jgi:hypothetical protein